VNRSNKSATGSFALAKNENAVWSHGLQSEVDFWRRWLTDDKFVEGRKARIAGTAVFAQYYLDLISAPPGRLVKVLDVGSGPVSTLGARARQNPVELVCADALADSYNDLLLQTGHDELPKIEKVKGEDLVTAFGESSFDIVHCANALDHFEDPALSFKNMYDVCRPGGAVVLISVENEGERENYQGLHQWNLRADDSGLFLGSRASTVNLLTSTLGGAYEWHYLPNHSSEFRVFRVTLKKPAT
jgi:ubiquinone/menaquinone biosynthesis C-methylase UbiE